MEGDGNPTPLIQRLPDIQSLTKEPTSELFTNEIDRRYCFSYIPSLNELKTRINDTNYRLTNAGDFVEARFSAFLLWRCAKPDVRRLFPHFSSEGISFLLQDELSAHKRDGE